MPRHKLADRITMWEKLRFWTVKTPEPPPGPGETVDVPKPPPVSADPLTRYLRYTAEIHKYLTLQGLLHGHVPEIELADVYVALKAVAGSGMEEGGLLQRTNRDDDASAASTLTALNDTSFYEREQRIVSKVDIEQAIAAHPRIAVLGEPGSGKTTFLRYLISRMLADPEHYRRAFGLKHAPVPILISARDIDPRQLPDRKRLNEVCVPEVLRGEIPAELFPNLLDRGSCVLIIDGLDEIQSVEDRHRVAEWIEAFTAANGAGNKVLVTSRIAGFHETPLKLGFARFTLCEFDLEDVRSFVYRWYEAVAKTVLADEPQLRSRRVEEMSAHLLDVMNDKPGIQQLAHNPLLLTIVLLVYTNRQKLPEERAKLYEECINVLLEYLQQSKLGPSYGGNVEALQHLRLAQRRDLLKGVARWLHENGLLEADRGTICQAVLHPVLPTMGFDPEIAESFLREVEQRSGLLVRRSGGIGFSHLAFQEFLTALCLAEDETEEAAVEFLLSVRFRGWWREIVQLYATTIPNATRLIGRLVGAEDTAFAHSLLLAGACLADARRVQDVTLRDTVIRKLLGLYLESEFSFHHRQARELLIRIGGREVSAAFLGVLKQPEATPLQMMNSVEVLARIALSPADRRSLLDLIVANEVPDRIRLTSIRGLRNSTAADPEVESVLVGVVFSAGRQPSEKDEAVTTLGKIYRDAATAGRIRREILLNPAYDHRIDSLYVASAKAFINIFEPEEALSLLRRRLDVPNCAEYKVELCRSVLNVAVSDRRRIEFLLEVLQRGVDWGARGGAALIAGLVRSDRKVIAHALTERLAVDREPGVGARIADALAQLGWRDKSVEDGLLAAIAEYRTGYAGTYRKLIEAYAILARKEDFIQTNLTAQLEGRQLRSVEDQVAALAALQRLRYYSEDFVSALISRLPTAHPDVAKAALLYITTLARVPTPMLDQFQQYLNGVLANTRLDRVLRDQAFEASYQLYGMVETA